MPPAGRATRLEAAARYFDGRSARPRDVVVSFGARSLVIKGPDEQPIEHWPMASLRALNARSDAGVELAPGADSDERLVLADPGMVAALRRFCPDLYRRSADRRGLRRALALSMARSRRSSCSSSS